MTPLTEQIGWYLNLLAARPASPRTIRTYRSELKRLEEFAARRGVFDARQLSDDVLTGAAADFMAEGARALEVDLPTRTKGNEAAARIMVIAARGMNKALRKRRNLNVPDLSRVETPRIPERLQPRVGATDYTALMAALERREAYSRYPRFLVARDRALVQFLMETGLRASECSRLNLTDVDLASGEVRIQQSKARKGRRLGILDPDDEEGDGGLTIRLLRVYLAERARLPRGETQRALWLGRRGGRLSPPSMRDTVELLRQEAALDRLGLHAFRRGWFTAAYCASPRDLPVLAARMGWSQHSQRMVAVYTRGAELDFAALPRPLVTRCLLRGSRSP